MDIKQEIINKTVFTGDLIGPFDDKTFPGLGCYTMGNNIYSALCGNLQITRNEFKNEEQQLVIQHHFEVINKSKFKSPILLVGMIVIGKVIKIKEDMVHLKIMIVDGSSTNQNIEGIIRKQNIREFEIDKIQMEKSFLPGDIVRAKIISLGDSQRLFLSTASDDLGVLFAKNQDSKQLMLPLSWEEMICLKTQLKEYRKVAKPNFSLFE